MRKNRVQEMVVHPLESREACALAGRVSGFHGELIARRLRQSGLSAEEQTAVLDRVLELLKERAAGTAHP